MNPTANGKHASDAALRPIRSIVFDWYDEPLGGVLQLNDGRVFEFKREDGDEFVISPLPQDAFERIFDAVSELGPPQWPVWVPIWKFRSDDAEARADTAVKALLAEYIGETTRAEVRFDEAAHAHA